MVTLAVVLGHIHATNSWLVLIVGGVAGGVLIVEVVHRGAMKRGGLFLGIFALLVYLQVALGASTALVKSADHEALFDDNMDKALWHAVLGIVAAVLATLALWMRRRSWRVAALAAVTVALVAPSLGRLIPLLLILAVSWALAEVTWRRSTAPQPLTSPSAGKEERR